MADVSKLNINGTSYNVKDSVARLEISNEVTERTNQIAALQSSVGSPLVASTVSAMTDHTKVYVYTGSESGYTSGHWYYWNGSAWTDGGTYNSTALNTDTTLSVYGSAADAKYAGNAIKYGDSDEYSVIDHDVWFDEDYLVPGKFYSRPNTKELTFTSNNGVISCTRPYRLKAGTSYYYFHLYAYFCPIIYDDGSIGYLSDDTNANLSGTFTPAKNGNIYFVLKTNNGTTVPNSPPNIFAPYNGNSFLKKDLISSHKNYIKASSIPKASIPSDCIENAVWKNQYITAEDLGGVNHLYNFESTPNVLYIGVNNSANTKILLKPVRVYKNKTYVYRHLYAYFCIIRYDDNSLGRISDNTSADLSGTFTSSKDGWLYITVSTVAYTDWAFSNGGLPDWTTEGAYWPNTVVVAKDGSGEFTKLIDAFEYTSKHPDTTVYVKAGTYDIIQELGEDYIANNTAGRGPEVGNNARFIFSTQALVTANYSGDRYWMNVVFSPINISGNGATFENMRIVASKVRYCIHDDRLNDTDGALMCRNKYINCDMYMNNSSNTNWSSKQCIGGGLGTNSEIIIEGCKFESVGSTADNGVVSYHNSALANAKSRITIKDCYFIGSNSGVRFGWYGESTLVSDIYLSGNSWTVNPVLRAETVDSTNQNFRLIAWNNELRT